MRSQSGSSAWEQTSSPYNPFQTVRPEGADHQWRKMPPRELSVDLVADERGGRVGAFLGPLAQPWPTDVSRLSSPPMPRLWQVLQLNNPLAESLGSKKSIFPSSTFSRVTGLPFTAGSGSRLVVG